MDISGNEILEDGKIENISGLFMAQGNLLALPKGSAVYSISEKSEHIYYINHGEVLIRRSTNEGKEIVLQMLGPGNFFGEMEVIQNIERRNTAFVKKDIICYVLSGEIFLSKLCSCPEFAKWILTRINFRYLEMENRIETLVFKSANVKVAKLLLALAKVYGVNQREGLLIDYLITHQEIGNYVATTRETVSCTFMELRQMGLIDSINRKTIILDKNGLQMIAEE